MANSCDMMARGIANKFHTKNPFIPFEDLYQEGVLGLYEAARKYQPAMGNKFTTVAYMYIRKYVLRYIENNIISGPRPTKVQVQQYLYDKTMSTDDFVKFIDIFINPECIEGYMHVIPDTHKPVDKHRDADFIESIMRRVSIIRDPTVQAICVEGIRLIMSEEPEPFERLSELLHINSEYVRDVFVSEMRRIIND